MIDKLDLLREENQRLSQLAQTDWLTGLYNRMAVEQKVNDWLKNGRQGTLFALDVDNFKGINDRYGHIAGDRVLQQIAELLLKLAFRTDIVGRIGGDEFIIFMPVSRDGGFIESRCRQIEQRFQDLPRSRFIVRKISLTVCGSGYQAGDDYQSLFDRADQNLLREKAAKKRRDGMGEGRKDTERGNSLKIDMERIARELSEPEQAEGAFCQDYDSFVCTYRFMERRLRRMKSEVFSILFTLTDERGDFPYLQERDPLMERLHERIRHSLRLGDVFTRYSSCQYLVMVCDVTDVQTDAIAKRILEQYGRHLGVEEGRYHLIYHRYPLKPAASKRGQRDDNGMGDEKRMNDGNE